MPNRKHEVRGSCKAERLLRIRKSSRAQETANGAPHSHLKINTDAPWMADPQALLGSVQTLSQSNHRPYGDGARKFEYLKAVREMAEPIREGLEPDRAKLFDTVVDKLANASFGMRDSMERKLNNLRTIFKQYRAEIDSGKADKFLRNDLNEDDFVGQAVKKRLVYNEQTGKIETEVWEPTNQKGHGRKTLSAERQIALAEAERLSPASKKRIMREAVQVEKQISGKRMEWKAASKRRDEKKMQTIEREGKALVRKLERLRVDLEKLGSLDASKVGRNKDGYVYERRGNSK